MPPARCANASSENQCLSDLCKSLVKAKNYYILANDFYSFLLSKVVEINITLYSGSSLIISGLQQCRAR
jgi:hypothetical protein